MKFSKTTGCFYPSDILYSNIPEDAIAVPHEDFEAAMTRGSGDNTLDVVDGRVMVVPRPEPTATQIKAQKWGAIKAQREAVKSGGVEVDKKWFHTDSNSRIQYLGLLEKAKTARATGAEGTASLQALGKDILWKTMDGSFITLTVAHVEKVFSAVCDLDAIAFTTAENHHAMLEAASNPADYDIETGWPAVFAQ